MRERFAFEPEGPPLKPRYNLAPGQEAGVVLWRGARRLKLMRWGLIPSWSKGGKDVPPAINARAETLDIKPMFKGLLSANRCLVLADGYYEWQGKGKAKAPWRYVLKDRAPFAMAGLWDDWRDGRGGGRFTFTIITTRANDLVRPVHDRMPAILRPEHEQAWLEPGTGGAAELAAMLEPYPRELMEGYQASPVCNSVARDDPSCIEPAPRQGGLFG